MKCLDLIYGNEQDWLGLSDEEQQAVYAEYGQLEQSLGGKLVGGAELQPTATAKSVRVRDGETLVTDGPFAETKEQLGGYLLIDADGEQDAIEIASCIRTARSGTIEVRPVVERGE